MWYLKKDELEAIVKGLEQVRVEIEQNRFVFNIEDEDIHMAIEKRLSELIGSEIGEGFTPLVVAMIRLQLILNYLQKNLI